VKGTERWKLTVADSRGQTVALFEGKGDPPKEIVWDGRSVSGVPVTPGITYSYVFEAVDKQRVATLASLSAEREAVLDAIRGERIAVLDGVRSERATVLEALRAERIAVVDAIREERIATLAAADSMAQRSIDHAAAAVGRLLLWVFVALLILAAIVGFSAVLIVRSLPGEARATTS